MIELNHSIMSTSCKKGQKIKSGVDKLAKLVIFVFVSVKTVNKDQTISQLRVE